MGNSGRIVWFTERRDLAYAETTTRLLRLFSPMDGVHVMRHDSEDTSWARFQEEDQNSDHPIATVPAMEPELLLRVSTEVEAAEIATPGVFTHLEPIPRSDSRGILRDQLREIPVEVRGRCVLSSPSIGVGGLDVWDIPVTREDDDAVYYGRSLFHVSLSGSFTPDHVWEFERRVVEVPAIVGLERDIESILGPLKRCIIWSV